MSNNAELDPEPFFCTAINGRHAREHEGYVYFEPRPEYSQNEDDYPDDIWGPED